MGAVVLLLAYVAAQSAFKDGTVREVKDTGN
jgi:hypothetical protein